MEVLRPYDVQAFNQLPGLGDSNDRLVASNGTHILANEVRDLFSQHPDMAKRFGVILLHRHFELKEQEALVDVNGSSTAWTLPAQSPASEASSVFEKYGGYIRPRSWLISGGKLIPYEFFFDNPTLEGKQRFGTGGPKFDPIFVSSFASILSAHGLDRVLGLYLLAGAEENLVEVTEGFANVTFTNTGDPTIGPSLVSTTWFYATEDTNAVDNGSSPPIVQYKCWPGTSCIMNGRDHIKVARHNET
jgi:hypothetical protein